ncbi:MAG: hypothetical protein U0359_08280 [Byssovorax sp.]
MSSWIVIILFSIVAMAVSRQQMAKRAVVWQRVAEEIGGRFEPSSGGFWKPDPMKIVAQLDDITVVVDHYTVSHGRSSTTYTRIYAEASGPNALTLKVYEEGVLSSLGKAFGTQDIDTGDRAFDDVFIVKSNDEGLARLWLDDRKLRETLTEARPYSLTLENRAVTSTKVGIDDDPRRLITAIRAVAQCAARGAKLGKRWRKLAAKLGGEVSRGELSWPGDQDAAIALELRGMRVTVAIDRRSLPGKTARIGTRVSAERGVSLGDRFMLERTCDLARKDKGGPAQPADPFGDPAFASAYTLTLGDARAARRLGEEQRRTLLAVKPALVSAGEQDVSVIFEGALFNDKTLTAAMELAADLSANASEGPYR